MKEKIKNLDWFITRKCKQSKYCKFCFAPWNVFPPDANLSEALYICDRIGELKIPIVTLCGGEPSRYAYIGEVVQKLHSLGIRVTLYSNAACSKNIEVVKRLLHYVDILSLPVDAISVDIVPSMRGLHQFKSVSDMLGYLAGISNRPKIKIGTVVTKQNIHDLDRIHNFLLRTGIVDVWRVYQYSPYGQENHIRDRFLLEDDIFDIESLRVKNMIKGCDLDVSFRSRRDNIGYCHIMDSQGSFYSYQEEYIALGVTIFDSPESILAHYDEDSNLHQKGWQQ